MHLRGLSRLFLCGVAVAALNISVAAQEASESEEPATASEEETELDLITVTVNKVKQAISEVIGGVSIATNRDVARSADNKVSDVLAPMPGVATSENADDPATAINIRGLQDFGRVAVIIDGARQNFQRSGHNANGMFYFEPEMMRQVTVIRGPIANVYGSGAIGGVVAFETIDALSFLATDENAALQERLRYNTNGDGFLTSTIAAARLADYGGVLGNIVYRNSDDYKDGNGDTVSNSGQEIVAGLVKGTFTPDDGHLINISYMENNDSFVNGSPTIYDNTVKAKTLATKYEWDGSGNPWFDLTFDAYWTSTEQDQERVNGIFAGTSRNFLIDTYGTDVFNTSRFATGLIRHTFTTGGDIFLDKVHVTDPAGTADLFTPSGERTVGGAFMQDQMELAAWLDLVVAGRFDAYSLEGGGANSSGSHFSPKATVILQPFQTPELSGLNFYGTYAEGYRAPAITETLITGIHPPPAIFTFLPNPDLKPETAHNIEGGVTGQFANLLTDGDSLSVRASIYHNKVHDYIGGVYNPILGVYQYQNISEATLKGIEAEVNYDAGWIFGGVAGSIIRGDNDTTGEPLETVPADKIVTTLGVRFLDQRATAGVQWFAVAAQDRVPEGAPTSDAYNLVNLFSSYVLNENFTLGFNVHNLLDENYEAYLDSSNSPGRSFLFTLTSRLGD